MRKSHKISLLAMFIIVAGMFGLSGTAAAAVPSMCTCDPEPGCTLCGPCTVVNGWDTCTYHCGAGTCDAT